MKNQTKLRLVLIAWGVVLLIFAWALVMHYGPA